MAVIVNYIEFILIVCEERIFPEGKVWEIRYHQMPSEEPSDCGVKHVPRRQQASALSRCVASWSLMSAGLDLLPSAYSCAIGVS